MENELNKWIHEKLLGNECWHEIEYTVDEYGTIRDCKHCHNAGILTPERPLDYCNDLNLASLAEAKAIELVGWELYLGFLEVQLYADWRRNGRPKPKPTKMDISQQLVTAPALTRVQAAKRAVEGK